MGIPVAFLIGRDFPYKNQFRIFILRMRQIGFFKHLLSQNLLSSDSNNEIQNEIAEVMINHVSIILLIFVHGFIISVIFLFLEILHKKYYKDRMN